MHIFESVTFFKIRRSEVYLLVNILPVSIVLKISLCITHGWIPFVIINGDYFLDCHWRTEYSMTASSCLESIVSRVDKVLYLLVLGIIWKLQFTGLFLGFVVEIFINVDCHFFLIFFVVLSRSKLD